MKIIVLYASATIAAGLVLVNIYNSLIDAKSWGSHIPESIATARVYFNMVNPGNFFRIFSPINQALGLLALIIFWNSSTSIRFYLVIALLLYISADALTFAYFYPRNEIMFKTAQLTDIELLKKIWAEWNGMNWVRTFIIIIGLIFSFLSLHKIYSLPLK
ncbi:MAG TPA: DUF1772 domain-containing protein [Nitrosopumilaceae archaeon]|jgi:hypothetical protein|nr:DUF1772 domain-containing protein [Nitrosopumilaceae archaeon]